MTSYTNRDFAFDGVPVHCIAGGAGFPILLVHGSGPGAATAGIWRHVLEPLAERYHVHAMDLIGFGASGRRAAPPYFDIDFWLGQCRAAIARMPAGPIGIVGHSVSGALALKLAAAEPRVAKVMTTGSMGARFEINDATRICWTFPTDRDALVRMGKAITYDVSGITDAWIAQREKTLFEDRQYGPYFSKMFEGDLQRYADLAIVAEDELSRIECPVTMMHGREDEPFPPALSLALANRLPQADVVLLARCSHSVALEWPDKFLAAARLLFG